MKQYTGIQKLWNLKTKKLMFFTGMCEMIRQKRNEWVVIYMYGQLMASVLRAGDAYMPQWNLENVFSVINIWWKDLNVT